MSAELTSIAMYSIYFLVQVPYVIIDCEQTAHGLA